MLISVSQDLLIHHLDVSLVSPLTAVHPHHHQCFSGQFIWELISHGNYGVFSCFLFLTSSSLLLPTLCTSYGSACHFPRTYLVLSSVLHSPPSWDWRILLTLRCRHFLLLLQKPFWMLSRVGLSSFEVTLPSYVFVLLFLEPLPLCYPGFPPSLLTDS